MWFKTLVYKIRRDLEKTHNEINQNNIMEMKNSEMYMFLTQLRLLLYRLKWNTSDYVKI